MIRFFKKMGLTWPLFVYFESNFWRHLGNFLFKHLVTLAQSTNEQMNTKSESTIKGLIQMFDALR